jgi:hypothetical protein
MDGLEFKMHALAASGSYIKTGLLNGSIDRREIKLDQIKSAAVANQIIRRD